MAHWSVALLAMFDIDELEEEEHGRKDEVAEETAKARCVAALYSKQPSWINVLEELQQYSKI